MAELRKMEHPAGKGRQVVATQVHEPERPHHHDTSLPPARQGHLRQLSPIPSTTTTTTTTTTTPQQVMRGNENLKPAPMVPHLDSRQGNYLVVRHVE